MQPQAHAENRLSFEIEEDGETAASVKGIYVHAVLERLSNTGVGSLSRILAEEAARPVLELSKEEADSIIASLGKLADHPLIGEIEDSQACYSERTFERASTVDVEGRGRQTLQNTRWLEDRGLQNTPKREPDRSKATGSRCSLSLSFERNARPCQREHTLLKYGQTELSYSKMSGSSKRDSGRFTSGNATLLKRF
jgi:hypothetical protein